MRGSATLARSTVSFLPYRSPKIYCIFLTVQVDGYARWFLRHHNSRSSFITILQIARSLSLVYIHRIDTVLEGAYLCQTIFYTTVLVYVFFSCANVLGSASTSLSIRESGCDRDLPSRITTLIYKSLDKVASATGNKVTFLAGYEPKLKV
jgi:hypothetical protein